MYGMEWNVSQNSKVEKRIKANLVFMKTFPTKTNTNAEFNDIDHVSEKEMSHLTFTFTFTFTIYVSEKDF